MKWVEEWDINETDIQDPQLRDIKLCRDLDYYVNTDSQEVIELGTKAYPYKNIGLVFIEILNFHSHSERTVQNPANPESGVKIFLHEYTTNYMSQYQNYIVNMSQVSIDSYTYQVGDPGRAEIFGVKNEIDLFSGETIMNLLIDGTLNLEENINREGINYKEIFEIQSKNANIYLLRSSLELNNINVYKDVVNESKVLSIFIKPLFLQAKNVTLTNTSFQTTGYILLTTDPMSLYINNVYIDFHANMAGIIIMSSCNYPEASKTGMIYANNLTALNSAERTGFIILGVLIHNGGNDFMVSNSYFDVYSPLANDRCMSTKYLSPAWFPDDDVVQKVSVINTTWTMPKNPFDDRLICFYWSFDHSYYRKIILTYSNNIHTDIFKSIYSVPLIFTTRLTTLIMQNNIYTNVSTYFGAVYSSKTDTILFENNYYSDSEVIGSGTFTFLSTNSILIRNITHNNVHGPTKFSTPFISVSVKDGGNFTAENVKFENLDFHTSQSILVDGDLDSYELSGMNYTDVKVGNGNSVIEFKSFKHISISDCIFDGVRSSSSRDENNRMVSMGEINLETFRNSTIQNIQISNSEIGFILFDSLTGVTSEDHSFVLRNISYSDSFFLNIRELFKFSGMQTDQNFKVIFEDNLFKNITFVNQGSLLMLAQQLKDELIIRNTVVEDVVSGMIEIEPINNK